MKLRPILKRLAIVAIAVLAFAALFATNAKRQVIISKSAGELIGTLGYDKWRVRIIVTSDDGQGFEGELRFTYTRTSLAPDHPVFHRIRTVPPLVRQKS